MKSSYLKGLAFSILSVIAFSINEVFGTFGLRSGASTLTIITVRSLIAFILFGITILIWNRKFFMVERKDVWRILLMSLFLLGDMLCFWKGLQLLKEISVMLCLYYLCPIWAALIYSAITKKLPSKNIIVAIIVGILGVMLVSQYIPNFVFRFDILGGIYMLLAGLFWALFFIASQFAIGKYHPMTTLFYTFGLIFIASLFIQNPVTTLVELTPDTLKYLVVLGIVTAYLAYLFLILAISFNKAIKTNTLDILAGVSSVVLALLVLGQTLTILQVLGIVLVISITYILKGKDA